MLTVDHLSKPNMHIDPKNIEIQEDFVRWNELMEKLSKGNVVVKMSGAFSEVPDDMDDDQLVDRVMPWLSSLFRLFGPDRIMWGSDWPVCKFGGGPNALARWIAISDKLANSLGLTPEDKDKIFYRNALRIYKL
jgi:L-rhamnono-1,4-lactonase